PQPEAAGGPDGLRQAYASTSALEASAAQAQQAIAAAETALRTVAAQVGERADGSGEEGGGGPGRWPGGLAGALGGGGARRRGRHPRVAGARWIDGRSDHGRAARRRRSAEDGRRAAGR